jgi:hypothetical protein
MPRLTAVTKQHHAEKSWKKFHSYGFASKEALAPLAGAEIARAISTLPLAFVKRQGAFSLVAVLSLIPGKNMFTGKNGQWLGEYVPAFFRGYPFMLAAAEGRDDLILCVNEDSGLIVNDKRAEPFFDSRGQLAGPLQTIMNFLSQIEQNRAMTRQAVAALAGAGVVTEWPLQIKGAKQDKPVTGLYRVDEAKLNALSDDLFLKLRKAGSLAIAYGQLLSMGNIRIFDKLASLHQAEMNRSAGNPNDDILSFQ